MVSSEPLTTDVRTSSSCCGENQLNRKGLQIDQFKHCVLRAAHPSPLSASRGFFGCHHFSAANNYLIAHHKKPIDWQLPLHLEGTEEL